MIPAPKPSWNPLRCDGTPLPPNLLLMAKLLALCLLLTNHVLLLPHPSLPFLPWLEQVPGPAFRFALQVGLVVSAFSILFNRAVRISCLALGLTMLLALASSRAYYGNSKFLCGAVLSLAALQLPGRSPWLLRLMLVALYLGAGLDKLVDPQWLSGESFHEWAESKILLPLYHALAPSPLPLPLVRLISGLTILIELGLVATFLIRPLFELGIWGNLVFRFGLLVLTCSSFTMYYYAPLAASLAFVYWPEERPVVLYDGNCGFCQWIQRWWERLDFERFLEWVPIQAGASARFGIAEGALQEHLHLVVGEDVLTGFAAFKRMILYSPLFYFTMVVLLVLPVRSWVAVLTLAFFFPPFAPAGEAVYRLVARNRHRLGSERRCNV